MGRHDTHMSAKMDGPIVLITGAAGYVGRFCVRHLLAAGYGVVALDRRAAALDPRIQSTFGDIADRPLVERLLEEHAVEVVLHLAADKSVADSMAAPGPHLRNNVCGSLALLEAMLARGVKKIVFSSSAAVYGTPERLPVDEQARLAPDNPYGAGKVMVEQALHWYHVSHGFDSVSLRYFNAAGAADDGSLGEDGAEAGNLVPRVMQALAGLSEPLSVYGTDFATATVPPSATTSTSRTWPRPMFVRSSWSRRAGASGSSTWEQAAATRFARCCLPPSGPAVGPSLTGTHPGGPAIRPRSGRTPAPLSGFWAGGPGAI